MTNEKKETENEVKLFENPSLNPGWNNVSLDFIYLTTKLQIIRTSSSERTKTTT
jgi:hypothetical protein